MSTTANIVFQLAMALANEIPNSGLFTASSLTSYKVRTPYILTVLEAELLREGEIFNTYTVTDADAPFSTAAADDVWLTIPCLPTSKALTRLLRSIRRGTMSRWIGNGRTRTSDFPAAV
jgi:hypothetical protein